MGGCDHSLVCVHACSSRQASQQQKKQRRPKKCNAQSRMRNGAVTNHKSKTSSITTTTTTLWVRFCFIFIVITFLAYIVGPTVFPSTLLLHSLKPSSSHGFRPPPSACCAAACCAWACCWKAMMRCCMKPDTMRRDCSFWASTSCTDSAFCVTTLICGGGGVWIKQVRWVGEPGISRA